MELKEWLETLKKELEKQAMEHNEQCKIRDIHYYKPITFDEIEGKEHPLFLVEKEVNGEIKRELHMEDIVIADIDKDNHLHMRQGFFDKELLILVKLRDTTPISLKELEEMEEGLETNTQLEDTQKQNKKLIEKKKDKDPKEDTEDLESIKGAKQENSNAKDIEIDINKKVTVDRTFADLVPEVKEKQLETVKIRRIDATRFEFYGINKDGQEVKFESLKTVEGTNPIKEITEVGANGEVRKDDVLHLVQIVHGTNEQNGNEGFSVDMETGIPKVAYVRRSRDNEYTSVPVNLKNTNQKRTDKEVQEYAEKTRNPRVSDNIEKADKILESQKEATLENIDDNEYNDNRDTTLEYEETLIKEAAKRCKISEEGFRKALEQERKEGEPIEQSIERTEDEINEQVVSMQRR